MRIEQRIGRIHRIGQTRDVFVFNLAGRGTIEDHVLDILESKINMFEMVIGEIEPILGRLSDKRGDESEFEDLIFDLWASTPDARERSEAFARLGDEMVAARAAVAVRPTRAVVISLIGAAMPSPCNYSTDLLKCGTLV